MLLSIQPGEIQGFDHLDKGDKFGVDKQSRRRTAADYDGLVLPGGVANPDTLRTDEDAVRFVQDFFEAGKPVGVICHGPWTLVEADVVRGRTLTSWPSLQTDICECRRRLGGRGGRRRLGLVTSRKPMTCRRSAPRSSRSSPRASTPSRPRRRPLRRVASRRRF